MQFLLKKILKMKNWTNFLNLLLSIIFPEAMTNSMMPKMINIKKNSHKKFIIIAQRFN